MSEAGADGPRERPARQLLRRVPILLAIGVGIWLWRGGANVPTTREIVWQLASTEGVTAVEVQITDPEDGRILFRQETNLAAAPRRELLQKAFLAEGDYPALLFVRRGDQPLGPPQQHTVTVGDGETILIPVDLGDRRSPAGPPAKR